MPDPKNTESSFHKSSCDELLDVQTSTPCCCIHGSGKSERFRGWAVAAVENSSPEFTNHFIRPSIFLIDQLKKKPKSSSRQQRSIKNKKIVKQIDDDDSKPLDVFQHAVFPDDHIVQYRQDKSNFHESIVFSEASNCSCKEIILLNELPSNQTHHTALPSSFKRAPVIDPRATRLVAIEAASTAPKITNIRRPNGKPLALVHLTKHIAPEQHMIDSQSAPLAEASTGKLLSAKLHPPFKPQSHMQRKQSMIVHSSSLGHSHSESSDLPIQPSTCDNNYSKSKYMKIRPESVRSIPSSNTPLPDLEVRPSSMNATRTTSQQPKLLMKLQKRIDSCERVQPEIDPKVEKKKVIDFSSPAVINKTLKSRLKSQQNKQLNSTSIMDDLNSKLKHESLNPSYFRVLLNRTLSKNNYFKIPPVKSNSLEDLLYKPSGHLERVPYRHRIMPLEEVISEPKYSGNERKVDDYSRCTLRSQERRQKQQLKIVKGHIKLGCVLRKSPRIF